jgi:hypothetical protein
MLPGVHSYQFYFLPSKFIVGSIISGVTLLVITAVLIPPLVQAALRKLFRSRTQLVSPNVTT